MLHLKLPICLVFGAAARALAENAPLTNFYPRQSAAPCKLGQLIGQVELGNGGRKIGIVIDSSGSMDENDPANTRLAAGKELANSLISSSEAIGGKTADQLTIIEFSRSANVLYKLGDPAGALSAFDSIGNFGGTYIGGGIKAAIDELSGTGSTENRTGIVVLTDGIDDPASGINRTIKEISRAGMLGIRVSFGFLSTDSANQDPDILNAVFGTGGTYTMFNAASSLDSFVAQVLWQGLTRLDEKSPDTITLLPGLTTSSQLSQTEAKKFSYGAKAGESLIFNITSLDIIPLVATLHDIVADKDVAVKKTDSKGVASIEYQPSSDVSLELLVTAGSGLSGIFSVGLESSILSCPNTTIVINATPTATATGTSVQFTGGTIPNSRISVTMLLLILAFVFSPL